MTDRTTAWLGDIDTNNEGTIFRGLDREHVEDLTRELTRAEGRPFREPLLVWRDTDRQERTGRPWVLLDGRHRAEAYKAVEWDRPVPVEVFGGDWDDALLAAVARQMQPHRGTTQAERLDAAWKLVRMGSESRMSARQIAEAASVSRRTVNTMRATLKDWDATAGRVPSGWWSRDKKGPGYLPNAATEAPEVEPEIVAAIKKRVTREIRDLLDRRKHPECPVRYHDEHMDDVLAQALGMRRLRRMFENMLDEVAGAEEREEFRALKAQGLLVDRSTDEAQRVDWREAIGEPEEDSGEPSF